MLAATLIIFGDVAVCLLCLSESCCGAISKSKQKGGTLKTKKILITK